MDDDERFRNLLLVYHQSYLWKIGIKAKYVGELVQVVNDIRRRRGTDGKKTDNGRIHHTKEYLYLDYISDALDKLGFLYFSRDQMKKHSKDLYECKYYLYNSIFNCKAFLDTLAGLLNHHYELGKKGVSVDLNHPKFLEDLSKKDGILAERIRKLTVWINKLSEWRVQLIHRHGIVLLPDGKNQFLMPEEPRRLSEAMLLKMPCVDPIHFCEDNIRCARLILEMVFEHIRDDIKSIVDS